MTSEDGAGRPLVTVSLVTFNGMRWLEECIASLERQTLRPYELLVIDNASTDGTMEWLAARASADARLSLNGSPENLGFARAHNRNILRARGEFVCLLNQDVELAERYLAEAVGAFAIHERIAAVQGRLRKLEPDGGRSALLDTTGLVMGRDRRAVSRGQGDPDGALYERAGPVWGADGPAPVYRRAALLDARVPKRGGGWEILDEDFFMYKEDVDLAWRLRLLGWTAWYTPTALAWHARGAGGTRAATWIDVARTNRDIPRWVKVVSWRNQRLMQLKNETLGQFLRDLPWIMRREALSLAFMIVADPRRLVAIPLLLRVAGRAATKRGYIQRRARARREGRAS